MGIGGLVKLIIVGMIVGVLARWFIPGASADDLVAYRAHRHRRIDRRRLHQQPDVDVAGRPFSRRRLDHVDRSGR